METEIIDARRVNKRSKSREIKNPAAATMIMAAPEVTFRN